MKSKQKKEKVQTEKKKRFYCKKKFLILLGLILVIIAGITTSVILILNKNTDDTGNKVAATISNNSNSNKTTTLSGSGVTTVGSTNQVFDIDLGNSGVTLPVEEVYVSSGDTVEEGDSLLKLSTEDISDLISYYENQVTSLDLALNKAEIEYNTGLTQAEYDYEVNLNLGETSLLEYNSSLASLKDEVTSAQEALDEANETIATLTSNIENDTFYNDYKLDELKEKLATSKKNLTAAQNNSAANANNNKINDYNSQVKTIQSKISTQQKEVSDKQTAYQTALDNLVTQANGNASVATTYVDILNTAFSAWKNASDTLTAYQTEISELQNNISNLEAENKKIDENISNLKKEQEQAESNYNKALEQYNQAVKDAQSELISTQSSIEKLESAYDDALSSQTEDSLTLKQSYEEDLITYQNAKNIYDLAVQNLDTAVNKAQEKLSTAKESLEYLETIAADGIIKAQQKGTIYSVNYEADDNITVGAAVVSYVNDGYIDVAITVSQDDIAKIAVGNSATVSTSSNSMRGVSGEVSSITTTPNSDTSAFSVEYSVTVSIDNSSAGLSAGTTAYVYITIEE